jgi:ABC-type polysaccharide/polyol phosphate export permease
MVFFPVVNVLNKKSLLLEFAILNIKIRYKGTYLGFLWTIIEPLLIFLLLHTVFTGMSIGVKENFAIYLLSGIVFYHIFSRGTLAGMTSLRSNIGILKSINLQREFFPIASTLTTAILAVIDIAILLALMPVFQFVPNLTMLLIPIPIILLLIFVLGMSYILSIIHIFIKDIQTIWSVIVQTLLFVSPIFWYLSDVSGLLLTIQSINPIGQLIELNHQIIILGKIPPLSDWLYTSTFVFSILFLGYGIFKKYEKRITEEL